mgnify:CR=1 FL=1
MPLSRLDNFLKNVRGNIIYVNPNDLDATDSATNQGNSMGRPFVTIQRALVEAARFSYQSGLDNDRFGKTTILLSPGEHVIDNRPGWIPLDGTDYRLRDGTTSSDFTAFSSTSNFDLTSPVNDLYKLNSIYGGVIVPRGVSIVGQDLRKTNIRPLYVPDPQNDNIERSAIFRITGGCYFFQFTIFDGNPNGNVYSNYTTSSSVANFSHHKLTCFEYADGTNNVEINDTFISNYQGYRTDLDMYYEKVGLAYGTASGREIQPDYPSSGLDIQPKIDEFRIVGPTGGGVGITTIIAGDGTTLGATEVITVTLTEAITGLEVDTAFQVNGITDTDYNGSFVVNEVVTRTTQGVTKFKYLNSVTPSDASPTATGGTISLDTDTVTSASPYIFNISLRSVFGMCGMHADGSKASGFKSMVVAQFTGVSLQKDDNAFCKFDQSTGDFRFASTVDNIHSDGDAKYRPEYYNFHIKASNNSVVQLVSIFAIGYAEHFVTESGGDFSVTNSNSNFGQIALASRGYRDVAFDRDDVGYITNVIPPKLLDTGTVNLEYGAIDVSTTVSVATTARLYLHNETNESAPPKSVIQGYRIGSAADDKLRLLVTEGGSSTEHQARIVMPDSSTGTKLSSVKRFKVGRVGTANSISSNTLTFNEDHRFINGETIRVISDNARLPDGLDENRVYYAIVGGSLNDDQIQIAVSPNDASSSTALEINSLGGTISVESRVSDKVAGDIGHPIQYDTSENQWYVNVSGSPTDNGIYGTIVSLGTGVLGEATSRTFINRQPDNRGLQDRIFRYRYVIPSDVGIQSARAPRDSYVLQTSNDVTGTSDTEVALQFNPGTVTMSNVGEMRNFSFIRTANYDSTNTNYTTELPHNLTVGSKVKISNVTSTENTTGIANSAFNGTFTVAGISSANTFYTTDITTDPGDFTNNTSARTTSLPTFQRVRADSSFYVYDVEQIKEYKQGEQDGIYYLTVIDSSNKPSVAPFNGSDDFTFSQPVLNLYPQLDRDNPVSESPVAKSYALPDQLGKVVIDDPKSSITKTSLDRFNHSFQIGVGVTDIKTMYDSTAGAGSTHTVFLDREHRFNSIAGVTITSAGSAYGNGTGSEENLYNAKLGIGATGEGATARITVNASGEMTTVKIMDGGCNYTVGDVLTVTGTATTTGFSTGTVTVANINNNIGDTISISGVTSESYSSYNQLYRVTGISTTREITVESRLPVTGFSTTGIGPTVLTESYFSNNGPRLNISSLTYNKEVGIGTVVTSDSHGLVAQNSIAIGGATENLYNGIFAVTEIVGLNEFKINIGISTNTPTISGTLLGYPVGQSAQAGTFALYDENFGGRANNYYAGISTVLSAAVTTSSTDEISIENVDQFGLNIGDYLRIDNEIMRIKTTVGTNPVKVFRGAVGTKSATHIDGSKIQKVHVQPIELRRTSITRASGHTFEYLGYGPGNYSTALPQRQSGQPGLTEQLLSQSFRSNGGVNVYTGMNDRGDFYIGNKRISSNTGKEEVFDTPVPTITGEDVFIIGTETGVDVINPLDATISRGIKVEGGTQNNILSEFNGPILITEKLTSTSDEGIESNSLFLQGDTVVSRKYTVGLGTPTLAGNPGDVVYSANPSKGGTLGWTYSVESGWYPFGAISIDENSSQMIFDKVGVGTTTPGSNTFQVGNGTSIFAIDGTGGVGIGTTANEYKLNVIGDSFIDGNTTITGVFTATKFAGDGSGLTDLQNDSLWSGVLAGLGTGIYANDVLNVGIGTTVPLFPLDVGATGSGTTDVRVKNRASIEGQLDTTDITVTGIITTANHRLNSSSGEILTGIITATNIVVGTALSTTGGQVGFGTGSPRADADFEGSVKFKTYSENVETLDISSGVVVVDLSIGQTFELTVDEAVTEFTLLNPPTGSTAFSIKLTQDSTGYGVGIDTFKDNGGTPIPVYWPGGGVVPIPTTTASKTDIYSFKTFDGGSSLYGVVGGQNFA